MLNEWIFDIFQLPELIEGLIEVHGIVKSRTEIHCTDYIRFSDMHNFGFVDFVLIILKFQWLVTCQQYLCQVALA